MRRRRLRSRRHAAAARHPAGWHRAAWHPVAWLSIAAIGALTLVASACSSLASHPAESGDWRPGTAGHEVEVGGVDRGYLLHVPTRQPRGIFGRRRPYPVVIVMHGSGGTADDARRASRMDSIADARGWLVAYPSGVRGLLGLVRSDWNAGNCCGAPARDGVDDVGFLRAIVRQLVSQLPVDTARVYVAGFSDGGRMAYRAACEMASSVAAVAVVSGSLELAGCAPRRPVSIIAFHGTSDDEVPYADSAATSPPRPVPAWGASFPPSIRFWIAANGCRGVTRRPVSPHASVAEFRGCTRSDLVLYSVVGGGHGWPGEPAGGAGSTPPLSELNASDLMANFFAAHRLR